MTSISVTSDLHLEFGSEPHIQLPNSEILILAGDITVTAELRPSRNDANARKNEPGGCRVVCNPHGYHNHEDNTGTQDIKIEAPQ